MMSFVSGCPERLSRDFLMQVVSKSFFVISDCPRNFLFTWCQSLVCPWGCPGIFGCKWFQTFVFKAKGFLIQVVSSCCLSLVAQGFLDASGVILFVVSGCSRYLHAHGFFDSSGFKMLVVSGCPGIF